MITKKHGTSDDAYSEFYANSHIEGRYSAYIRGARCGNVCDFSKSILPRFNFRTTSEKTGTHGMNVLATWIG